MRSRLLRKIQVHTWERQNVNLACGELQKPLVEADDFLEDGPSGD